MGSYDYRRGVCIEEEASEPLCTTPGSSPAPSGVSNSERMEQLAAHNRTRESSPAETSSGPAGGPGVGVGPERGSGPPRAFGATAEDHAGNAQEAARRLGQNGVVAQPGQVYVVQIDQEPPTSGNPNAYLGSYTGQTCVFRANDRGELEQIGGPYRSSSHPQDRGGHPMPLRGQNRVGQHNVDGDGRGTPADPGTADNAWLRPGAYHYGGRAYPDPRTGQNPQFPMQPRRVQTWYDADHDGRPDVASRTHEAIGINIHAGGRDGPASVGCQNIHPDDFDGPRNPNSFQQVINRSTTERRGFTYVLARRPNDADLRSPAPGTTGSAPVSGRPPRQ